jgi:hypothetical protein
VKLVPNKHALLILIQENYVTGLLSIDLTKAEKGNSSLRADQKCDIML